MYNVYYNFPSEDRNTVTSLQVEHPIAHTHTLHTLYFLFLITKIVKFIRERMTGGCTILTAPWSDGQ